MSKDFEVFQPSNEHLAQVIAGILEGRGYDAGYQLGYPHNKVFIRSDSKEEADKISRVISKFMEKHAFGETGLPTPKLNVLIGKLADLIPPQASEKGRIEKIDEQTETVQEKTETKTLEASETDSSLKIKLEQLRSQINDRIKLLEAEMTKDLKDPLNENRAVECEALNWVLQNMP